MKNSQWKHSIKIGNKNIGSESSCYIIAEIGINHNGDIEIAKQLIEEASKAKADAVKFQKRTVNKVYTEEFLDGYRESPFGTSQRELKYGLEFNENQYRILKDYAIKFGLEFIISPWDEESVDLCMKLDCNCFKVASPCLHDHNLLKHIGKTGLPLIVSTGMSDEEQINDAFNILKNNPIILMHCISCYPTLPSDANLRRLQTLYDKFPCTITTGYSGHEKGWVQTIAAVAMGAKVVERHLTLDRDMWGSDQAISIEPKEFELMVSNIREIESAMGNSKICVLESERLAQRKLQRKRKINLVILDIDGVITDGKFYFDQNKFEAKSINYKDLDTVNSLKQKGYTVCIITKENSEMNKQIIEKLKPDHKFFGCTSKWKAVMDIINQTNESITSACYIGDSYSDIEVFRNLDITFCPDDAIPQIKSLAKFILTKKAGEGSLVEMLCILENINRGKISLDTALSEKVSCAK